MSERNVIPLILTAIGSVAGTVAVLSFYGYVHVAKPEDALLLADYTMLKTVPGEDYRCIAERPRPRSRSASTVCWCCSIPSRRA